MILFLYFAGRVYNLGNNRDSFFQNLHILMIICEYSVQCAYIKIFIDTVRKTKKFTWLLCMRWNYWGFVETGAVVGKWKWNTRCFITETLTLGDMLYLKMNFVIKRSLLFELTFCSKHNHIDKICKLTWALLQILRQQIFCQYEPLPPSSASLH